LFLWLRFHLHAIRGCQPMWRTIEPLMVMLMVARSVEGVSSIWSMRSIWIQTGWALSSLCLLCRGSVTIFQWFVSCPEISFAYATIFFQLSRFFFLVSPPFSIPAPASFFMCFQGEWKIAIALFLFSLWVGFGQFEFDLMKLKGRVLLIVVSLNSFQRFSWKSVS